MSDLVTVAPLDEGALWRVTFGRGVGNILDCATMVALRGVFSEAASAPALRAICLDGAGAHFSYGAAVQEHTPDLAPQMLREIRQLVFSVIDSHVVVVAAVRGQCLGGGLELASVCHRIIAHEGAVLGQPEIALGAFAPIASIVLPERIGRARAEDLCLTGRAITASEAHTMGLVDEVTGDDPADVAMAWARAHVTRRSASSLRLAVKAVRVSLSARLRAELPELESIYLNELMRTPDAIEGVRAFLEKRPPVWNRRV